MFIFSVAVYFVESLDSWFGVVTLNKFQDCHGVAKGFHTDLKELGTHTGVLQEGLRALEPHSRTLLLLKSSKLL